MRWPREQVKYKGGTGVRITVTGREREKQAGNESEEEGGSEEWGKTRERYMEEAVIKVESIEIQVGLVEKCYLFVDLDAKMMTEKFWGW